MKTGDIFSAIEFVNTLLLAGLVDEDDARYAKVMYLDAMYALKKRDRAQTVLIMPPHEGE